MHTTLQSINDGGNRDDLTGAHIRHSARIALIAGGTAIALSACASPGQPRAGRNEQPEILDAHVDAHGRDLLTTRELASHPTLRHATAYDAVSALRPEYLTIMAVGSTSTGPSTPSVLINGTAREGFQALRTIDASIVREIRFVRPAEAVIHYGREYRTGVIVVTTVSR